MNKFLLITLIFSIEVYARDMHVVSEFKKTHTCQYKSCVVDHIIPLCAGGADSVYNMQFQEKHESYKKDIAERELCKWIKKAHDD